MDSPPQARVRWAPLPQARLPGVGELDSTAAFGAERILDQALPPITPDNVSSIASDSFKRQLCGDKTAHVFWAWMECGLVFEFGESLGGRLSTRRKGRQGGATFAPPLPGLLALGQRCQQVPFADRRAAWEVGPAAADPGRAPLYEAWVKDRIEFYKRVEPTAASRDRPLRLNRNLNSGSASTSWATFRT